MKVYYHSALGNIELEPGGVLRAIPCKAYLELYREKQRLLASSYIMVHSSILKRKKLSVMRLLN